jgi:hypothetical protein
MRQLFVIIAPTYYRNLNSPTHTPIAHYGPFVKDQWQCICRSHGHRVQSYLYFEKMNYPSVKDNIVFSFPSPFLCPYLCPDPSWPPSKNVAHHGPCPEWHECNVTPLWNEVQELEKIRKMIWNKWMKIYRYFIPVNWRGWDGVIR